MDKPVSIGRYLLDRLYELGVRHIFGIPGDYVLGLYAMIEDSRIQPVITTREDCAGFAADAYARMRGLGAVCVTYCVGGLNLANPIAGAYAEKSPVVVISGAPGVKERAKNPLLHHKVREFTTQKEIFDQLTVAGTILDDPLTAFREIDRVLDMALRYKRPVYIELPRDMTALSSPYVHEYRSARESSNPDALKEALDEAVAMINASRRPVILADVEVHRFGLQRELVRLAEKTGIPVAATVLGKSVISEVHPAYLGVYEGAVGPDDVRRSVEDSDCLIMLGSFMTDINLGIFTARLDQGHSIYATSEKILIRYHRFEEVLFEDFVKGLIHAPIGRRKDALPVARAVQSFDFHALEHEPIRVRRLFEYLNLILDENMVVTADIGDALFGSLDLRIRGRTEFFSPAYYTSMGFAVPAAIGAQLANSKLRAIAIVGDGAFQMTGLELSTAVRLGLDPIIIVLNNGGYGTERVIENAERAYNDIVNWRYHRLPDILGKGQGYLVRTEGEFVKAVSRALENRDSYSLLEIQLDPKDCSPAMERIAKRLSGKIG